MDHLNPVTIQKIIDAIPDVPREELGKYVASELYLIRAICEGRSNLERKRVELRKQVEARYQERIGEEERRFALVSSQCKHWQVTRGRQQPDGCWPCVCADCGVLIDDKAADAAGGTDGPES